MTQKKIDEKQDLTQKQDKRKPFDKNKDHRKNNHYHGKDEHHHDNKKEEKQDMHVNGKTEHKKQNNEEKPVENKVYKYIAFVSFKDSKKIYTFGTDEDIYKVDSPAYNICTLRKGLLGYILKTLKHNQGLRVANGMIRTSSSL